MRGLTVLVAVVLVGAAVGDDWPQWQGPKRDGVWREAGIVKSLPAGGPKIRWRKPIHGGYGGPAVADGLVYVHDFDPRGAKVAKDSFQPPNVEGLERLVCLDAATGVEKWVHAYPCKYTISYACGPRCTPTVDGDLVYALGAQGRLSCVDAKSGRLVWEKELTKEYGAKTQTWGFSSHPTIAGDMVVVLVGGKGAGVVAFDKKTGAEKWKSVDNKEPGYSAPVFAEFDGRPTLICYLGNALTALEPEDGKVRWSVPTDASYGMSIMTPIVADGHILAAAYTRGGVLVQSTGAEPKVLWNAKSREAKWLYPVNVQPVKDGDYVYGADTNGEFRCVKWPTGERVWETFEPTVGAEKKNTKNGSAFYAKNGDRYYILSETGDFLIAKFTPEKYEEISRHKLLEATGDTWGRKVLWSSPAFANKSVYARNDDEIVCASLAE